MPLPIPDILEKASKIIRNLEKFFESHPPEDGESDQLYADLANIHPGDLIAVLNEVGMVYTAAANPQIAGMGCAANLVDKTVDIALKIVTGFGPRDVVLKLQPEQAKDMIDKLQKDLNQLRPSGLILG